MNIAIGALYGLYVSYIIDVVPSCHYGLSFGLGIGISCILSYLLYALDKDYSFMMSVSCLYFYGLLSFIIVLFIMMHQSMITEDITNKKADITDDSLDINTRFNYSASNIILISTLFVLISITYALGYFVPAEDISAFHISVEVMRLMYFVGLVLAGFLNDKSRKYGFILCLITLTFAFSMPLIRDNPTGVYVAWMISYFMGGFITVCRAIFFTDIAQSTGKLYLAPMGVAIGRTAEPIGMILRLHFESDHSILLFVISFFFAVTIIFFVAVYSKLYLRQPEIASIDYHSVFADRYKLSSREIEILDEILDIKSNKEIAARLFITESTVKFHVKNLMKKTGCKNRNELIKLYNEKKL